jgi:RHS repeat-associated protein
VRAPSSGAGTTLRSYSRYADAGAGNLTRYYYLGDRLVGSWTVAAPAFSEVDPELILPPEPIVLPPGLLFPAAGLVLLATFLPLGGRRRLGVRVSLARSAGVSVILLSTSLPVVVFSAGCGTSSPSARVYHLDRLGSTQLVTDWDGGVYRHVRYYAYGEIRGRFDVHGNPIGYAEDARREFTGYETDFAGLDYAGARFFDPELAQFGTHDPAGQYPSPYAYGPGDPINGSDPTGSDFWEAMQFSSPQMAVISAVVRTYKATHSWGKALTAGVKAGASYALIALTQYMPPVGLTLSAMYFSYEVVRGVRSHDTFRTVMGAVGLLAVAYGAAQYGSASASGSEPPTPEAGSQGDFVKFEPETEGPGALNEEQQAMLAKASERVNSTDLSNRFGGEVGSVRVFLNANLNPNELAFTPKSCMSTSCVIDIHPDAFKNSATTRRCVKGERRRHHPR